MTSNVLLFSLENWWSTLNTAEQLFWAISIVSSVLFLFQFVLSLVGLDVDTDTEIGGLDIPDDVDVGEGGFSLDADFSLFSIRSIIAFFTFFGWTGVLMLRSGNPIGGALIGAFIAGFAAMLLVAYLMFQFAKLTKPGNVNINEALYQTGEVYLTIPPNKLGKGKIHFHLGKTLREMDAVTDSYTAIPNGAKVRIVDIIDDNLLIVEPEL